MQYKRILIIDDESLIRKTTAMLLKQEGFVPLVASGGYEGLEMFRKEKPDMVLLDIMMPEMDGWDVLEAIRSDSSLRETPVIIFTAVDFAFSEKHARERGAKSVLRKPFHLYQLRETLKILEE